MSVSPRMLAGLALMVGLASGAGDREQTAVRWAQLMDWLAQEAWRVRGAAA